MTSYTHDTHTRIYSDAFVRQSAPEITRGIVNAGENSNNEAELVKEVERILAGFASQLDITLHPQYERTLINGRADAVYNRFVIEYEPHGSLRKDNTYHHNQHAIGQVKQYMEELERLDRQRKERLAGLVLDGAYYIFVRFRDDNWYIDEPVPINSSSTEMFLRYLLSLSTGLALTPDNLVRDFGENSNTARNVVPVLYTALKATDNRKVGVLFGQWQRQFREVSGYDPKNAQLDAKALARSYAVQDPSPNLEYLFFAIHTYYATFIKLLALQVAHHYLRPEEDTGLVTATTYDAEDLWEYLLDMEHGGLFADLGIRNFLEGDFFGWHLEIWDNALYTAMRRLVQDLSNYSLVTLDVDPEETRDLLKHLYQNLMPKKLRHALGEYYTPDWLAERLLDQLEYHGEPRARLLDPACGSGTFLVLAIKRIKKHAEEKSLPSAKVLEQVLGNIIGFDLNPLAVMSARTNYLLALGDLLSHRQGDISIPVYIADSILTPAMEVSAGGQLSFIDRDSKVRTPGYSFTTVVGRFTVPHSLVQARYIDQLADLLEECVYSQFLPEQFKARLLQTFPLDEQNEEDGVDIAVQLYERLLDLEKQGVNGIWARIIKNAFAPLFQGRFNYIAGNPPWVNWESLPADYRQETKPLWVYHNLFPHGGMDTILGKGKKDISTLMTFVALENYLTDNGKLGFIITQSVLKSAGAGQGFRRFTLGNDIPVAVITVDDMVNLQPFEGASNRTAILIMSKGQSTKYPVPYHSWCKTAVGKRISENSTLNEVLRMTAIYDFVGKPVDQSDLTSSWISGRPQAVEALQKILGASDYQARAGVCTWLNGVYWLETVAVQPDGSLLVSNLTEGGKKEVVSVQAPIEPDLLYPLLRGSDVHRWHASSHASILMVQDPVKRRGYDLHWLHATYPKTYAYLEYFEAELRKRSGYIRYFKSTDPFYSMFTVSDYTFAPFKVVWPNIGSEMTAAVVSEKEGKPIIPQHIITLVACEEELEAHYICAVLNSAPFDFAVQSYSQRGGKSFATPQILETLRVPHFDSRNLIHQRLALLSQHAHDAAVAEDQEFVVELEEEIDWQAAQLWGLLDSELQEVKESLAGLC